MVETQRRTLQISLRAQNLSKQAFLSVERSLKRIREAGRRAFDGIARVARSARGQLLGVVAAVGGTQKLIIEPAEFEDALARITIAGDGFADRVRDIRRVIEELATSTGTSRDDLAAGFENAAKRVETFEEAVLLVDSANKLAAVSGGSVADSVTGLSAVIENFGGSVSEVDSIAAKLFETTRRLPESAGEILTQIGNIAPQARLAGLSVDDLLAAVATAEQQGVRASSTFTALRTILDQITSPAGQAEEGFAKLGVETGAAALEGRNVGEVFAQILDRSRELGVQLGDLGLRGRSVNAFLAIASGEGREFSESLETISSSSIPEFQRAFDRVNSTTKSSIDAFRELTKVAASAFAGAYLDDFGAALGDANSRVEQVRIRASLAGLEFRQWVERLRPGIAAIRLFFEAIDSGLSVVRTQFELLVPFWVNIWNQVRLVALDTFLSISDFVDNFIEETIDKFTDLGLFDLFSEITGGQDTLVGRFYASGIETTRDQIEQAKELGVQIGELRERLEGLDAATAEAIENSDRTTASIMTAAANGLRREIEEIESQRAALVAELADKDPNADLRATVERARQAARASSGELRRVFNERLDVNTREGQDVIDAFDGIGESAIDADRNVRTLNSEIAKLQRELAALLDATESGDPIPSAVEAARAAVGGATSRAQATADTGSIAPTPASGSRSSPFSGVESEGNEAADEIESRFEEARVVVENSLGSAFSGFIRQARTAKEVAQDFLGSIADGLARIASQELASAIFSGFNFSDSSGGVDTLGIDTGTAGGGVSSFLQAADGGVIPVRPFADGGAVRSDTTASSIRAFAAGGGVRSRGLFSGATLSTAAITRIQERIDGGAAGRVFGSRASDGLDLGLFAEAGSPEAIVQLPDGESVPLRLDGGQPVVALPGGRTVPVRVTGDGLSDSDAMVRLRESLEAGGGAVAPLGPGGGVLREPTLARIPESGPGLAAIPLPIGESIPVKVSPDGSAVVQLPKGRALPTMGTAVENLFRGPRVAARAFADGGIVRSAVTPVPRRVPTGGPSALQRVTADGGMRMGDSYNVTIQALDGPSVQRVLSSPEGRRAVEGAFRNATQTRRDFRR